METISAAGLESPPAREVVRCEQCHLVQYRTANNHCRRCLAGLFVPPPVAEPAPAPEAAAPAGEPAPVANDLPDVAGAIRHMRQRQGLSQRELAERMHVPRTYVSKIENDKAMPTIASLERMAQAMETSIPTLLQCTGSGMSPAAVRELLADGFVRQLMPFVPHLAPEQMDTLIAALRQMTLRRSRVH